MLATSAPYQQYFDADGTPLDAGYVYFGVANSNPETSPITVYWDSAGTQPASQPIRTQNGFLYRNGTPAQIFAAGDYSITVRSPRGDVVSYLASAASLNNDLAFVQQIADYANSSDGTKGTFQIGHLASGTGATGRTLRARLDAMPMSGDFATITAAVGSGRPSITLESGTYAVASNLTITTPLRFMPGAKIVPAAGVTVTINATVEAGVYQIFDLSAAGSSVVLDNTKTRIGYAEWWGAVSNSASGGIPAANTTAINAALVALRKVEFMPADYFVSGTIVHQTPNTVLSGPSARYDTTYGPKASRLLLTSGSGVVLQIGPAANPGGGLNSFPRGIEVRDIYVARSVAPVIASASPGITLKYATNAIIERVQSAESIYGWQFVGTNGCRLIDCDTTRASAGTGAGTDSWRGYYIDGITDVVAAGGNASLFMVRCTASCNNANLQTATGTAGGTGYYADGAFSDLFIDHGETTTCYNGMQFIGNNITGAINYGNVDAFVNHPINDQFNNAGIFLQNIAKSGSITIHEPYMGPSSVARASLWFSTCSGGGGVRGGQFVQGGPGVTAQAIIIDTCNGIFVDMPQILETRNTYPVIGIANSNNCSIRAKISNWFNTAAAAVQLSGTCTANVIEPFVMGKASAFTLGIQIVGTADARNEYRCTGIDSSCISGGSGNKLTRNAVQITTTGLSGSNLVSGVMT